MKFPPEHYPNPGIQHTRAVVALTVTTMCHELFKPAPESSICKHMDKIRHWIAVCAEQTKKKPLSAGARRASQRCCDRLAGYVPDKKMPDDQRFRRWAALVWAASIFILDTRATCPLYAGGRKGQSWRWLLHWVDGLAEGLREIEPSIDEEGTRIYEEAAWALEGVEWHATST